MAIEYMIEHDCPIKEKLTAPGLVQMLKQHYAAAGILEAEKKEGKSEEHARGVRVEWDILQPGGGKKVAELSIGEMLDGTRVLEELQTNCQGCPAAMGEVYGCIGNIHYPISARAEQWLGEITQRSVGRADYGNLPVEILLKHKDPGEDIRRLRQDPGGRFFESKRPVEVTVSKGMFSKKVVTTDGLLDFFFASTRLPRKFLLALTWFSGGVTVQEMEPAVGTFQTAFFERTKDGRELWHVFNLPDGDADDKSTREFKRFFRADARAYSINAEVTLDR